MFPNHKLRIPLAEQKRIVEKDAAAIGAALAHGKSCSKCRKTNVACKAMERLYAEYEEAHARAKLVIHEQD